MLLIDWSKYVQVNNYYTEMLLLRLIFIFSLLINNCLYSESLSLKTTATPIATASFKFKRLLIADTEVKALNLHFPSSEGKILIMDIPSLNCDEFAQLILPFYNHDLNSELIEHLNTLITDFVHKKLNLNATVLIPNQNITQGDLRLVVIIGRYKLARLYLTSISKKNTQVSFDSDTGQIVLNDLPTYLSEKEFSRLLAHYFYNPITPDSVNRIILDISSYVKNKGGYLAITQIPNQNTENGLLRLELEIGKYPLKRLVITSSQTDAASYRATDSSNSLLSIKNPLYATDEFKKYIRKYLDKPITVDAIAELRKDLVSYGKSHDRLLVDTDLPFIDLYAGEIKIAVLIGHYNKLHLKGNRWFSDDLIQHKLGIKTGDEIKISELDNAVTWANKNPFRQVQVVLDTMDKGPGEADLDIAVNEILPVRLTTSFSNAINSPLGNSSYSASAQIGNLWGLDHELNYQYSTNNTPKYDQSHSVDYKAPVWGHGFMRIDFSYSLVYPQSLFGYIGLNEKAKNSIADIRYIKPVTHGPWTFEYSAGFDYKQVNTNLIFGSTTQSLGVYDVAQLNAGLSITRKDLKGAWTVAASINESPGNFNNRNSEYSYAFTSTGAGTAKSSVYQYGKIMIERDTNLPLSMQLVSRGQIQISTTNLQSSEQLLIGGGSTVRGYSQSYSGDQGWVINQELRSRYFETQIPFTHSRKTKLYTQFVSFLDYGKVSYKHPLLSDIKLPALIGSGIGIRCSIYGHFSMGSDLSFPIITPPYSESHPTKGTFWVNLSN